MGFSLIACAERPDVAPVDIGDHASVIDEIFVPAVFIHEAVSAAGQVGNGHCDKA